MNHYLVSRFRKKLKRLPVADYHGLKSPGLTCYLNSVLQVLFMTENFRDALKSPDHRCGGKDSPIVDPELRRLFDDLQKKMAETRNITEKLGITDVFEQRDAAEYFEKILCLTSPDASKIFKGELNHRTTCCKCNTQNNSSSFFWILPLMVEESSHKTYNVEQGLEAFFELQQVSGDDQIYCNSCDEKQNAYVVWEMTQHPDVLTLLLKRFTFDYKLKRYIKLHCKADVPQTLHMEKCTYDLYAVVNHFGSLTGGHYTAEIKSYENGQWYCFNDRRVKSVKQQLFGVEENSLRSSTAYILLYRKEPPETDGSDQDTQCAHLDVEAEGRSDEVEREEATFPHYHPEKYNDKGKEIPKNVNSNLSKNCRDDGDWRKPNQTAAWTNNSVLPQVNCEADEQQHDSNTEKRKCLISGETRVEHFRKNYVELTKAHEMICEVLNSSDTKTGTKISLAESSPRRNGFKSSQTMTEKIQEDTAIRRHSRTVRPSQDPASSVQHPTSLSKCHGKTNEPSNYKNAINQGRNFSSLNSNTAKTQHVVTTDSKLKSKHTVIKNEQTVKVTKEKSVDQSKRPPWR